MGERVECKYGRSCFRRHQDHFIRYSHHFGNNVHVQVNFE